MSGETFRTKRRRELSDFALGLPAVVAALTIVPLLFFVWRREGQLEYTYRQDAEQAFANGNQELAIVCFDRLVRLRPNDQDRLQLANWLKETGQSGRSEAIIKGLAPSDRRGFGPAHLLTAKEILQEDGVTAEDAALAISHLNFAQETLREGGEVDFLLAKCYWQTGSIKESLEALRDAATLNPKYYYDLFIACQQAQVLPAASTSAKLTSDYLKPIIAENPMDRVARARYAEAQVWLDQFREAELILKQGMDVDPDGQWHRTLAKAYLAQFRQRRSQGATLPELLALIEKAIAADPETPDAIRQITALGGNKSEKQIQRILENVLTTGRHNAVVHFVLGSRKLQARQPDIDGGLFHMQRAFELDGDLLLAANNLAYHELLKEDGDFEAGLKLIQDVLQRFPDSHAFRETRGQLLTRLGRFEEALSDLEYALSKYPNERLLHASLAQCYRELGQSSLGERHAEKARRIAERQAEEQKAAELRTDKAKSPAVSGGQ